MRRRSQALDEGPEAGTGPWEQDLARWMAPFLAALGHKGRQRRAPVYLEGLLGPGDRKSVQPMAARIALDDHADIRRTRPAGAGSASGNGPISGSRCGERS